MLRDLRPLGPRRAQGLFGARRGNRRVRPSAGRTATVAVERGAGVWARALLCVGLAGGVGAAGCGLRHVLLHGQKFALQEVRFSSLRHLDRDRLLDKSGLALGRSLFALDLGEAERRISREPWVRSARVRRELPRTVAIDVVEREPRAAVALGASYLVDERGEPFKRARAEELSGLPVLTGVSRERYLTDPSQGRSLLRRAIELAAAFSDGGRRAMPSEIHHEGGRDAAARFTVYFIHGGRPVGVRLEAAGTTTPERLRRLDAVLAALDAEGAQPALIHLDQRVQLDRVAVQLADAAPVNKQSGVGPSVAPSNNQAL